MAEKVLVSVIMGSKSDWDVMRRADETLTQFEVPHECKVLSAHRTPKALEEYIADAQRRGAEVFIAAAGGAAHLAGVIAAQTAAPVLGVPMESASLKGLDSLLAMVQMPAGDSGGNAGHRQGGSDERGAAGGGDSGQFAAGAAPAADCVSRGTSSESAEGNAAVIRW